ncbi:MAG: MBL fold metallo-hydrolase RNA specificity domain-containing protein [Candidatus Promineifilaceae bacterium]
MKITFLGAAGVVTGSCYLVETDRATLLVDFGLFQGSAELEARNRELPLADVSKLDAVLLTHAHLDHSGRLPLLERHHSYRGPIFATEATIEMAQIILEDSARINVSDTERENRKRQRAGRELLEPLYEPEDAAAVLEQMVPIPYDVPFTVAPGMAARLIEAGHMLGSASIQLAVEEDGRRKVVLFSGDIGPHNLPIMKTAESLESADLVIMESTYGNRDHKPLAETLDEGEAIVRKAVEQNGKILVPAFAIGRTQQLAYHMAALFSSGTIEPFPVYIDSPMAIRATEVYRQHTELFDEEAMAMLESGRLALGLETITPTSTAAESKAINDAPNPCMVIATSGMCTGGRILHHLRHNLWRPETTIVLVGYQAEGTLGRALAEGADRVFIWGDEIRVNASVQQMGGLSAHAGQSDLLRWFDRVADSQPRLVLTHGEAVQRETLAAHIQERYGITAELPFHGDAIVL